MINTLPNRMLDEHAAADYCGLTVHALRRWRQGHGDGPAYAKLGRAIRYDIHDLDKWIERSKRDIETAVA